MRSFLFYGHLGRILSLLPAKSVGFFWSASEFSIPIVSTSPGLSNENCGRGLRRLVGSVPRMALLSIFFFFFLSFQSLFLFLYFSTFLSFMPRVCPLRAANVYCLYRIWYEHSEPGGLSVWKTCRRLRNWSIWRRTFRKLQHNNIYHRRWLWWRLWLYYWRHVWIW